MHFFFGGGGGGEGWGVSRFIMGDVKTANGPFLSCAYDWVSEVSNHTMGLL